MPQLVLASTKGTRLREDPALRAGSDNLGFAGQNRTGAGGYPNFAGGAGQVPGGATASAAPAGTTGTVKLVDGGTIYLQTADGGVVTVTTTGKTRHQHGHHGHAEGHQGGGLGDRPGRRRP